MNNPLKLQFTPLLFTAAFVVSLLITTLFPAAAVAATAPSGTLTCGGGTATSIILNVTYANTGTAGANLYRHGAPANGQIAHFPGNSGSGSHTDKGLNGTYWYQLRSGTTVLANRYCSTVQPAPASAPSPSPAPAPSPAPTPAPKPAPAPKPTPQPAPVPIAQATPPAPAVQPEPAVDETAIPDFDEYIPEDTTTPATTSTDKSDKDGSGSVIRNILIGLSGLLFFAALIWFLIRRHNNSQTYQPTYETNPLPPPKPEAVSLPAPVVSPASNLFSELIPVPVDGAAKQDFDRRINNAFYPSRPSVAKAPLADQADDIPDMYALANAHPESYGSAAYKYDNTPSPNIPQPPAGPDRS